MKRLLALLLATAVIFTAINAFAQSWLTNSLVGYYPLAVDAKDYSGGGNDGGIIGSLTFLNANGEHYASFNGTDSCIYVTNLPAMNQLPLTCSAWVKPTLRTDYDPNGYRNNVLSSDNPPNYGFGIGVNVCTNGAGGVGSILSVESHNTMNMLGVTFSTNSWSHVVVVYDQDGSNDRRRTYVNGQLIDEINSPQQQLDGGSFLLIGRNNFSSLSDTKLVFKGGIKDARVYNRALSSSEVAQLYAIESVQSYVYEAIELPPFKLIQAETDDANRVYVLGAFTNSIAVGTNIFYSRGNFDLLLLRYSVNNSLDWVVNIGSVYNDPSFFPDGVRMVVKSNICVLAGWEQASVRIVDSSGAINDTAFNTGNKVTGTDGYLLNFDMDGRLHWKASITGTSANDGGSSVAIDNDGNILWSGSFNGCCPSQGSATITSGTGSTSSITSPSYGTGFILKFNPAGTLLWSAKCYNRDATFQNGIACGGDGSVIVQGFSRSWSSGTATTVIDALGTTRSIPNPGSQSSFIAKFNASGVFQWSVTSAGFPDGVNYANWTSMKVLPNGDILSAGNYNSAGLSFTGTDGVAKSLPAPNGQNGFAASINSAGAVNWISQIGTTPHQTVSSISASSSGAIILSGTTTNGLSMPGINLTSQGLSDGFLATLTPDGSVTNLELVGGLEMDEALSVIGGNNGVELLAGNQSGGFTGLGVAIPSAGPFILVYSLWPVAPQISSQPQSRFVDAHDNVSFSVTATGSDPLCYQWSLNGTNLLNATNSILNVVNVRPWNLGDYAVVVTNYYGSATSEVAQLTMYPFLANPFTGFATYWGQTNILSVGAWGSGNLSYQWFFNGAVIPDATNSTFTLPAIQFTNAGLYSVVVSSPYGSVTNTPYQVVVNPANVTLRICPDVMIEGTVGYAYVIESTTDLSNTNAWIVETNFILSHPIQHWNDNNTDINHPNNPRKFYRVSPGQ